MREPLPVVEMAASTAIVPPVVKVKELFVPQVIGSETVMLPAPSPAVPVVMMTLAVLSSVSSVVVLMTDVVPVGV